MEHGAVTCGPAAEVMPLDKTGETATLAGSDDVDHVSFFELVREHAVTLLVVGQDRHRRGERSGGIGADRQLTEPGTPGERDRDTRREPGPGHDRRAARSTESGVQRQHGDCPVAGEFRRGRPVGGGDRERETLGDVRTRQLSATPVRKQKAVIFDIA